MTVSIAQISTDKKEYCRYGIGLNTIVVNLIPSSGTIQLNESFIFSIKRPQSSNWPDAYRTVMTKTISATSTDVSRQYISCSFVIGLDDVDTDGIARAISGRYEVSVSPSVDTALVWSAPSITIVLVSSKEIRSDYCYGVPLRAAEVLAPRFQPKNIVGVTIDDVSSETTPGPKSLVLVYDSGSWTLAWDGGAAVPIVPLVQTQYLLMDEFDINYIIVSVVPSMLPQSSISERILIALGEMTDELIVRRIENAVASAESQMGFPLEPMLYTSIPLYAGQVPEHNKISDHWDRIARACDYIVPADPFAWPSFKIPVPWCLKLHRLYGFHSVDKIVEIQGDWWGTTIDRMSSYVTLVPALASFARWTVFTHPMLAPFFMGRNIPAFWQYEATCGLPNLQDEGRSVVREMIARTAAASILVEAQRAYQGGVGSESTGRDGLSNSRSFNPGGPYGSTIQEHRQWLQLEVPRIKQKLGGVLMGMLGSA